MKKYPQYRRRMLAIVLTLLCFTSCSLCADIFQWIGSDSQRNGLFSDPTCWYPQTVPYHWDTAYFNQNQTYSVWFNNSVETWDLALHTGDVRFTPDTVPLFREYKFHPGTIAGGTLQVKAMKLAVTDYLDMWGLVVHAPTLIVEEGGTVVCGAMKHGGGNYNLSQGTMTIAGSNASVTAGSLRAGVEGTGEVIVFQGTLTVPDCIIGESDWGELNVVGGQSIFAGQTVTVGASWVGLVEILNGAKASAITCSLGIRPDHWKSLVPAEP